MKALRVITAVAGVVAATLAMTATAAAEAETGVSNGLTYTATEIVIAGSTPDGAGSWKETIFELSGGDPAVVAAFNRASRSAAAEQVDPIIDIAKTGLSWEFESSGRVSIRSIAIGQVIRGTSFYGVSPTVHNSTVVIDTRTAEPIMLSDLFTDEQAGLNRLSEQTKILLPFGNGPDGEVEKTGEVMPDQPGNAPVVENFVNWLPTSDGLEIHFAAYQFGIRMAQSITVPWAALTDVLAPDMTGLMQP